MSDAEQILEELNPFQIDQLRTVAGSGPRGFNIRWSDSANPFTLYFLDRRIPGLLTGFSTENDPKHEYVTLTNLGREVVAAADHIAKRGE